MLSGNGPKSPDSRPGASRRPQWGIVARPKIETMTSNTGNHRTEVFISHAAVDGDLALALKDHLEHCFPGLVIFVSSDPEDLPPGSLWIEKILEALDTAKCVLALSTERGMSRKWVWFESGRTWFTNVPLIPCCVGTLRKTNLPAPFSSLQALEIDEASGVTALVKQLAGSLGREPQSHDAAALASSLVRLDVRADENQKIQEDGNANEIFADIDQTMATLVRAERETIRHFVMYGQMSTATARMRIRKSGLDLERWSVPWALIGKTGWLVQLSGNVMNDPYETSTFTISPEMKPFLKAYFDKNKTSV